MTEATVSATAASDVTEAQSPMSWWDLLDNWMEPENKPDRYRSALQDMTNALGTPRLEEFITRIIERQLAVADPTAFNLLTGLRLLVGTELAAFLCYVATDTEAADIIDEVGGDTPEATATLRRLLGQYGSEMGLLVERTYRSLDDWRFLSKQVRTDHLTGRVSIWLKLIKVNGEEIVVEAGPTSILNLTSNLLEALGALPTTEGFSPSAVDVFFDSMRRLQDTLSSSEPEDVFAEPDAVSAPAVSEERLAGSTAQSLGAQETAGSGSSLAEEAVAEQPGDNRRDD
jgi:hypothetical protein